jgi:hypothetical protein
MRIRKRSSWLSGSGKVPIWSAGFWVAITKKGSGSGQVWPSALIWRSSIASSRALWALGVARLISSARSSWANTGPDGSGSWRPAGRRRHPDDVGRQHVAGELDALELQAEQAREDVGEGGLADAGDVLDEQVAAGEDAGQGEADGMLLAEDDAAGGVGEAAGDVTRHVLGFFRSRVRRIMIPQ